jgi:small basic protein
MAGTIFASWCIFTGLEWAANREPGVGLAVSDLVLTLGMAVCANAETDQGTRRWIGLIQLLAAVSMVVGGVGAGLQALGFGPAVFNILVVNQLTSAAALAFLLLATMRRMKLNADQPPLSDMDLVQLPASTAAIN